MPAVLPLTDLISQKTTRSRRYRVLKAQFGDGYSQTAPDGINNTIDTWKIMYENLSLAERTVLLAAVDSVGAFDYLTWTPPNDTPKRFKLIGDVSEQAVSGDIFNVSFELEQVFL